LLLFFCNIMKKIILPLAAILFLSLVASAQGEEIITVFETVRIKNDKCAETLFYYENNWKMLREKALAKEFIHSYELIETAGNERAAFDIILITRYADKDQFAKAEENFRRLIEERGPVKLLNELKPNDFRENVFAVTGRSITGNKEKNK
jgi:hypothetical protein